MQVGMGILAFACIGLGLIPFIVVPVFGRALAGLGDFPAHSEFHRGIVAAGGAESGSDCTLQRVAYLHAPEGTMIGLSEPPPAAFASAFLTGDK